MLVPTPRGSPSRPFDRQEQLARFRQELRRRVSDQACDEIECMAQSIDGLDPRRRGALLAGAVAA
jgi:hypothetical protein